MDEGSMRAWRGFLEAHARVVAVLEEELRQETGLPLTWYDVLVQLSEAPDGRLRMQELARAVLLSKSGLTRLVDRISEAGYIERTPDPADGRATLAAITALGHRTLREAAPVHLRGIEQAFTSMLTPAERDALIAAFERIVAALAAEARTS